MSSALAMWKTAIQACLHCFQSPSIDVGGRQLEIERLLGEGGFAYVYLVRDRGTGQHLALKKIRCPFGGESVANAMREVEAYTAFKGVDGVIQALGSSVQQEPDGTRTVYVLLPYFSQGNLQDLISDNYISGESFPEAEIVGLSIGIGEAIRKMHRHRQHLSNEATREDYGEDMGLLRDSNTPEEGTELGEVLPWAHRDIKPANIMFNDAKRVVLMDLGSCSPARLNVSTRQLALEMQDMAAEHCTLPYRAPELFNVKTGSKIDEGVDIWSFGCTIYAMMYGMSPFEREEQMNGASLQLAAETGRYSFPNTPHYSDGLKDVVRACMTKDSAERPRIDDILAMLREIHNSGPSSEAS